MAKKQRSYRIYEDEFRTKDELVEDPPLQVELTIPVPEDRCSCEEISAHLWENYHFELECAPGSAYYQQAFTGPDARSLMGSALTWECGKVSFLALPKYYRRMEDEYGKRYWEKLVEDSEVHEFGTLL
jgi:hypothetical protein